MNRIPKKVREVLEIFDKFKREIDDHAWVWDILITDTKNHTMDGNLKCAKGYTVDMTSILDRWRGLVQTGADKIKSLNRER